MANNFTPTTNAEAIPTIIAQETIRLLPSFMGLAKFISKDVDWTGSDFANYGQTLNIVKPGDLSVQTKSADSATVNQVATATSINVSLDRHKYIRMTQEDITKLLQKPDLQQDYARIAAMRLAEEVEQYLFGLHVSLTETETFDTTSEATVRQSMRAIRDRFAIKKVAPTEIKGLFADTSIVSALLDVDRYTSGDYVRGPVIEMGALTKILNIGVFESQNVQESGSPVTHHNIATTKYGMVLVNRPLPLDGNGQGARQVNIQEPNTGLTLRMTQGYSIDDLGSVMVLDWVYGGAIADTQQIFEVENA